LYFHVLDQFRDAILCNLAHGADDRIHLALIDLCVFVVSPAPHLGGAAV
jgi:hypothetical protein